MHFKKNSLLLLLTLFSIAFFTPLVTSQGCEAAGFMGKFQQDSNVTLTQTCPTCTTLNITVTNPNSTILFTNVPMTLANGIFSFDANSTISQTLGIYFVQGVSNLDNPFKSCYIVTNIERDISTSESIIYLILTGVVFLMFLFCVWGGIGLPARNRRNELNRVIGIEIWKYPKIGCMFLAYAFFTWFINMLLIMSNTFVTLTQYSAYFTMIFNFLMAGVYVFFVATIVIFFILAARDLKLRDLLVRGIQPR